MHTLENLRDNYDDDIQEKKTSLEREKNTHSDMKNKLDERRRDYGEAIAERSRQETEAKVDLVHIADILPPHFHLQNQEQRINDREEAVRALADQFELKGFNVSPLGSDKIIQFTSKLDDLLCDRKAKYEAKQVFDFSGYPLSALMILFLAH